MKRGDLVTVRQKGVHTSKPRPAVIVQASALIEQATSVVVCLLTSELVADPPFFRIDVQPTEANGLAAASQVMVDRPIPIRVENMTEPWGELDQETVARLDEALALFLDLP